MQLAKQKLKEYFGFEEFRPDQETLIEQVLGGRDILGVMPTGAGKSLVYQVPALTSDGLTIVVSPLISLMKDQVDTLQQAGVRAACWNSDLAASAVGELISLVESGYFKLLYVAPERLVDDRFRKMLESVNVSLVAVDEAHCVSQWGNDFRPAYTKISAFIKSLPIRPCVCALTATATDGVRQDIIRLLDLRNPYICVAGFDRQNLYFGVEKPVPSKKNACLLSLVEQRRGQSGIVYCSTRASVEDVQAMLVDHGFDAVHYHAGLPNSTRRRNQEDFLFDRVPIIVATNAFGMGIDKSNVGFVIHYNMPGDIESYYQEAGRAGRDGSKADCILIYNKADVQTANYFAERSLEERTQQGMDLVLSGELYKRDLDRVRQITFYCTTTDCLRSFFLRYFGEQDAPFRCENCSSCSAETKTIDATVDAQKVISCVLRLDQRGRTVGRAMIVDILRGSQSQKVMQSGFDTLSTYDIMGDVSKDMLHALVDALVAEGYLRVTDSKYPVLVCTEKGREFLTSKGVFALKVAKKKLEPKVEKPAAVVKELRSQDVPDEVDQELFEELRALRYSLAQEQGVAAFIIFSDRSLRDMCAKLPRSYNEFLEVAGVGKSKADRYATAFVGCIEGYFGK